MSKKTNGSVEESSAAAPNRTLKFFRFATRDKATRRGYKIEGHPGCLVIERSLFADGDGPEELILNVDMVSPKEKVGAAEKEAAKLVKAHEREAKAAARLADQQAKMAERAAKLASQLEAAKAKAAGTSASA